MKKSVLLNSVVLSLLFMTSPASALLSIPNTPLTTTASAPPLNMLVASKDHRLFYEAYNDASDLDGDGALDIRFKPSITYYGLFDSNLCYTYSGSGNSGLFTPVSQAENGKCPGKWSGNWLNYVTTSRIDALRKVLYGGYREVDTTTQTILRRAYIPQDAHSWAKEYTSVAVDGYDIRDYTPLPLPESGKRHFFGNLTANADTDCATLNTCSDLSPLLAVVTDSTKRVWEWASKERPVLDDSHGGKRTDYTVRVEVCTPSFHDGCKQYPNGTWKPVGLLHDFGENEAMFFGLLTGSYNRNMSGGVLRKAVSSFKNEINPSTGQFNSTEGIVATFNNLRIRDFNNNRKDKAYRGGWLTTAPMSEGQFVDWGNPLAEMLYEALRYFAGKKDPTNAFVSPLSSAPEDSKLGLSAAKWDDPYASNSLAKAPWCAKPVIMAISDVNVSFDSDQLPGSYFSSFTGDLADLNVQNEANTITALEPEIVGSHFIGQSGTSYDSAPTAKTVTSLGTIRGLAPEEPTKQGSYYSASVAYFGKRTDLRSDLPGQQNTDLFAVALASPLPRFAVKMPSGQVITLVPFAKSVGGSEISSAKGQFQPTNQIVDFYITQLANSGPADANPSINGGRYYAQFTINYEDVEQGADHDMDVIAEYTLEAQPDNTLKVTVRTTYQAGGIQQNVGYIISGTTRDGVYLVAQDEDIAIPYFLNVPPGESPGYCDQANPPDACKKLPCATGSCSNKSASVQIFSPGTSSATLLKDPLWYAAKWGGFVDRNNNGRPDLQTEWDNDEDGVPDTYFLVQNPLRLKETLKRALETVVERTASAGNVTSNSTSFTSDSLVFQSIFNTVNWSGDLIAYPITASGISPTLSWKASDHVPIPATRKLFTRSGGSAVPFLWSNLSSSDQGLLGSSSIVDYLRGERSQEQQFGGTLRNRASQNVLGDIIHSSPYYVKETDTVYVGANDGMLHAFNASNGEELFAYIPSALIPKLKNLSQPNYTHDYFVDGDIVVSNRSQTGGRNYLVATLGRGGKGLFGLDVTNPNGFSTSDVKWECFDSGGTVVACNGDPDLGYMLGRSVIAKMNNGDWAVIVGNGYNSTSGKAVLYIFDLATGAVIKKIDTGVAGDNGLAPPAVVDEDNDGDVDVIYAGDLKGNVWKFDVSSTNTNQWKSAFMSGATPQPFFVAMDSAGNPQPITAQITVAVNPVPDDPNYNKRYLFFGTGSYFRSGDPGDPQVQSWYGLIDEGTPITGRSDLKQRSIESEGTFDGKPVRTFGAASAGDMVGKKGWFVDFTTRPGERIVTASKLFTGAEPVLIASSIIPKSDPCLPGGDGFVNAINPFTGGRLTYGFFDLNDNKDFSDDTLNDKPIGGVDLGVGMPSEPVIVGDRLVVGGSKGTVESVRINVGVQPFKGRISWREIILEN
ncbi:hypothetical protein Hthe01_19080 [Hydrogenophilus thermoluteolus]|uniref:pilus assembly protein n=1 Tax=Hydrogenophilus thermoluteolus TaxID=297 RepID=UPI00249FBD5B|nr:PilC/PilY family type IV pilus protein [Hydrogenophilus thermoluteolus]GLW61559.1 hypothetical protein Hthe01_19080 [Hydrogenophilus thermoluteolus]